MMRNRSRRRVPLIKCMLFFLPLCAYPALAQTEKAVESVKSKSALKIKGVVLDERGETVIGAIITDKSNASNKTVTDMNGNFSLGNVAKGGTIVISCIGYVDKVVTITSDNLGDITLSEDIQGA